MPGIGTPDSGKNWTRPVPIFPGPTGPADWSLMQPWIAKLQEVLGGAVGDPSFNQIGFSDTERDAMIGGQMSTLAQSQQGASNRMSQMMASRGLSGSGVDVQGQLGVEQSYAGARANALRDVFLQGEQQKRTDINAIIDRIRAIMSPVGQESKGESKGGWSISL